jgi:hypothetical protein
MAKGWRCTSDGTAVALHGSATDIEVGSTIHLIETRRLLVKLETLSIPTTAGRRGYRPAAISTLLWTLAVLTMLVPGGGLHALAGPSTGQPRTLTPQEAEAVRAIHSQTQLGAPYRLDLADPLHYRLVTDALRRTGLDAGQAPQLFRALERARARGGTSDAPPRLAVETGVPQPLNIITYLDRVAPRQYAARALSSVDGGTDSTTILVELLGSVPQEDLWTVYAFGQGQQYGDGTHFTLGLSGTVPTGDADATVAHAIFVYFPRGELQPVVEFFRTEDTVDPTAGCMEKPNYCIRDGNGNCVNPVQYATTCTNQVPNTIPIKLCYYRKNQQECDYYNPATGHPTDFIFPLAGSVQFPRAVDPALRGSLTIVLQNPQKGGGCFLYFKDNQQPLDKDHWSAGGNTLRWAYDQAAFPDPGQCLEYYGGTTTYLALLATVALDGGSFGAVVFTSDRSDSGAKDAFIIPAMEIWQGCLAAGTQVRMADGSLRAVESFTADHREKVRAAGGERTVWATTRGIEPDPMVRLKTDGGQELLLTATHPVITDRGAVMAMDLSPGDRVRTEGGTAQVTAVTREAYRGQVYNLSLGTEEDAAAGRSTFYANGILVGDARTQTRLERLEKEELATDPRHVLERLPREWHEDYKRALERRKKGGR